MDYVHKYRVLYGTFAVCDGGSDGGIVVVCSGAVKKVRGFCSDISFITSDDNGCMAGIPYEFYMVGLYDGIRDRREFGGGTNLHALRNSGYSSAKMINFSDFSACLTRINLAPLIFCFEFIFP